MRKTYRNMYELYENGRLEGIYNSAELCTKLNMERSYLYQCAMEERTVGIYMIKKSSLTYKEAQELKKRQPEEMKKPIKKETVKNDQSFWRQKKGSTESAGRTFRLPDWNRMGI